MLRDAKRRAVVLLAACFLVPVLTDEYVEDESADESVPDLAFGAKGLCAPLLPLCLTA